MNSLLPYLARGGAALPGDFRRPLSVIRQWLRQYPCSHLSCVPGFSIPGHDMNAKRCPYIRGALLGAHRKGKRRCAFHRSFSYRHLRNSPCGSSGLAMVAAEETASYCCRSVRRDLSQGATLPPRCTLNGIIAPKSHRSFATGARDLTAHGLQNSIPSTHSELVDSSS
jgi:hypothetical protein